MHIKAEEIGKIIEDQIRNYDQRVEMSETGTVLYVGDGIARVYGVNNAMSMELLEFPGGIMGMVLNLEEDNVGVALLGDDTGIKEGDPVKRTGKIFSVPVGEAVVELVRPIQEEAKKLLGDKVYLEGIYKEGAQKASYLAEKTLRKVYKKVGFVAR